MSKMVCNRNALASVADGIRELQGVLKEITLDEIISNLKDVNDKIGIQSDLTTQIFCRIN